MAKLEEYRRKRRFDRTPEPSGEPEPSVGKIQDKPAPAAKRTRLPKPKLPQLEVRPGSQHGDTILTNAAMVLLLKQKAEIIDAADSRFRLTVEERQWLLGADKGEGLLFVRGSRVPIQIVPSPAEYSVATTNPRDLAHQAALMGAPAAGPDTVGGHTSVGDVLASRAKTGNGPVGRRPNDRGVYA